jgi:tRNA(Ile)-lysidine synthase
MTHPLSKALQQAAIINKGTPLLLACSGGRDSMSLLHLLIKEGYQNLSVAHCNFKLRAEESEGDQKLVETYCEGHGIPFYCQSFETKEHAQLKGISIQMAARELRYEWLESLRKELNLDLILTAHHADDLAETILFQLTQGTGVAGMKGMTQKNEAIFRPLLYVSGEDIRAYAEQHQVPYREDSSNASTKYKRNFIRHEIVPKLQSINPQFVEELSAFSRRMADTEVLMQEQIKRIRSKALEPWKQGYRLHLRYLLQHPAWKTLLFELLHPFGCSSGMVEEIQALCRGEKKENASGQCFITNSHRLVFDEKSVYILPLDAVREEVLHFDQWPHQIVFNEFKIDVRRQPIHEVNIKQHPRYAYLDAATIQHPISLRYPKTGDYFYPFGMGKIKSPEKAGKKKLSKFFKDIKLPVAEREATPLLFSGDKLAWVVGQRTDDRFKINDATREVICLVITRSE